MFLKKFFSNFVKITLKINFLFEKVFFTILKKYEISYDKKYIKKFSIILKIYIKIYILYMSSNIQRSENNNDICKFENCNRIANYRKLKVVNCHLKNTKYEFCGIRRPKWSINRRFPYKTIFDQHEIKLKYYNQINEHILNEHYNYILNLYKNHKFGFPIKTTVFTENLLYNIKEIDNDKEIDVTNITNYQKYCDTNSVRVKDIIILFVNLIAIIVIKKLEW